MPRRLRVAGGGYAYHVPNRAVGRMRIFGKQRGFLQEDDHLWTVLRYVERNPLRANIVQQADAWRWSSPWHRVHGDDAGLLDDGPVPLPRGWRGHVQSPQTEAELEALRRSVVRGAPFGEASWQSRTAKRLGLQSTLRPRGRPWNTVPNPK